MYTTPLDVETSTGYANVTMDQVRQAQFVIEVISGKTEADVDNPRDKSLLARAVAAQVVYMRDNPDITFEQVKASSISRGETFTSFNDDYSPFVAPLAMWAMQNLSWRKSRSVRTGRTFQRYAPVDWRRD